MSRHVLTHTQAKRTAFVYVARRFMVHDVDTDKMVYFLLSTMRPHMRQPFDIVLDLTMFSFVNEPSAESLERFASVLPPDVARNLGTIFIVNPPSFFRVVANKRLHSLVMSAKLHKKIKFISSESLTVRRTLSCTLSFSFRSFLFCFVV